jgi:hypothetical protein
MQRCCAHRARTNEKERSVMRMNDMTLTLLAAGIAAGAARTRSRSSRGGVFAGIEPKRDRVAVAGGAH